MINELTVIDTFHDWMDKLNDLIESHNSTADVIDSVVETARAFTYNRVTSSGLVVRINGGRVRSGSLVETIADTAITLPANSVRVLAIYKMAGEAPSLKLYATNAVPDRYIIPVGIFTTNGTTLTAYTDLRTMFNTGSGDMSMSSGVLQFDKIIDTNVTIPPTKNALSVSPTVPTGVAVTVSEGSVWVVL